jgi:PKD repeat protein
MGFLNEGQLNPDTANDIICGVTTSLSLFALVDEVAITAPLDPVEVGTGTQASTVLTDPGSIDSVTWDWGDGTSDTILHPPADLTTAHVYSEPGVYTIRLSLDAGGTEVGSAEFQYVVVYDPSAGFVTGGGWIQSDPGFCSLNVLCADASGKANFGFVSKYKKGANVPTGQTQFEFKAGNLTFHSTEYEWLVVSGAMAQFKGSGAINGGGDYGFLLTAADSAINGGPAQDTFRIKIWDKATETTVYDNGRDQPIGGGSIVIHTK